MKEKFIISAAKCASKISKRIPKNILNFFRTWRNKKMDFHLHPMVVHFPVALFLSALLFEIISVFSRKETLHQTAVSIYTLAVAAVPFAVITGLWEAEEWNLTNHKVFLQHRNFAFLTLGISLISFFIVTRGKKQL